MANAPTIQPIGHQPSASSAGGPLAALATDIIDGVFWNAFGAGSGDRSRAASSATAASHWSDSHDGPTLRVLKGGGGKGGGGNSGGGGFMFIAFGVVVLVAGSYMWRHYGAVRRQSKG